MAIDNNTTHERPAQSVATPETQDKRARVVAAWQRWCAANDRISAPARAEDVRRWCRERAHRVGVRALRNDIVALRRWHEDHALFFPPPRAFAEMLAEIAALPPIAACIDRDALDALVRDALADPRATTVERAFLAVLRDGGRTVEETATLLASDVVVNEGTVAIKGRADEWLDTTVQLADDAAEAVRRFAAERTPSPRFFSDADGVAMTIVDAFELLRDRAERAGVSLDAPDIHVEQVPRPRVRTIAEAWS
jgi:site-specific recombinase XerD